MCIIAYRPAGVATPTTDTLKNCWDSNADGAGFMYRDADNVIVVKKGFMTFEDFIAGLLAANVPDSADLCMHFRIASHGKVNPENTHPWIIRDGEAALCHNGIVQWLGDDRNVSDSLKLADLLGAFPTECLDGGKFKLLVGHAVGSYNKVVVMTKYETTIVNEQAGQWSDGCWFSNSGFRRFLPQASYIPTVYEGRTWDYWKPGEETVTDHAGVGGSGEDAVQFPPDSVVAKVEANVGANTVTLTMEGEEAGPVTVPLDEFIDMYDLYIYKDQAMLDALEPRVTQWLIEREHLERGG